MKELYISPELEILCFLPMEGIATTFGQQKSRAQLDDGLSNEESRPGDFDVTVPGEDFYG